MKTPAALVLSVILVSLASAATLAQDTRWRSLAQAEDIGGLVVQGGAR